MVRSVAVGLRELSAVLHIRDWHLSNQHAPHGVVRRDAEKSPVLFLCTLHPTAALLSLLKAGACF